MPDQSPSNADGLNSNFLQLGRRSGGQPQRTVYPRRLPVNTVIHTTLAGIEPTTFRLLVRRATSCATETETERRRGSVQKGEEGEGRGEGDGCP